jgi:hypothetical protein
MQGAVEASHMNHPDFRVNGRIFATLHSNDRFGMVALTPEVQQEFLRASPTAFEPSSGAWGRQGCTNVRLEAADVATVRPAMILAWEAKSAMPPPRTRKPKATPPAPKVPRARRGAGAQRRKGAKTKDTE